MWQRVAALLPSCCHFFRSESLEWQQTGNMLPLKNHLCSMETQIAMPGKPYQSCLIPHENEIMVLRQRRPPMPYAQIAELLREKYQLCVCRETVFKFLRVRSRGRKVFSYGRNVRSERPAPVPSAPQPANSSSRSPAKPKFEFKYSERYNLHRLPPEEASARRKKLEEEGH